MNQQQQQQKKVHKIDLPIDFFFLNFPPSPKSFKSADYTWTDKVLTEQLKLPLARW